VNRYSPQLAQPLIHGIQTKTKHVSRSFSLTDDTPWIRPAAPDNVRCYSRKNFQMLSTGLLRSVVWLNFTKFQTAMILDEEGCKHFWNVRKLLPDYTPQQPRRQPSSYSQPARNSKFISFTVFTQTRLWILSSSPQSYQHLHNEFLKFPPYINLTSTPRSPKWKNAVYFLLKNLTKIKNVRIILLSHYSVWAANPKNRPQSGRSPPVGYLRLHIQYIRSYPPHLEQRSVSATRVSAVTW
jgi:hypothetical protein